MASAIRQMTTQIAREESCCRYMGYSFWLAARFFLYNTYQGLCYTSRRTLAGTRRERQLKCFRVNGLFLKYGVNNCCITFIYSNRKEGNVLFNDALNTFYLRLYGVRTTQIARDETRCCHIGYSFRLAARVLLYGSSHRQESTYHGLCYTSRGSLAGTRNRSMVYSNTTV